MKEGRARDVRREVGALLREERVEMAKPKVERRRIDKLRLASSPGQPGPPRVAAPRGRLTIDDPFDLDDAEPPKPAKLPPRAKGPLEVPVDSLPAVLALPSGALEASIPSVPPAASVDLEATLPSIPPGPDTPPRRAGTPHMPGAERLELDISSEPPPPRRQSFELEAALPSTPKASPGLAAAFGDDLEASLRPPVQRARGPLLGGEIELGDAPALRVDLKSDLPPRGAPAQHAAVHRGPPIREARPVAPLPKTPMPQRGYGLVGLAVGLILAAIAVALADQSLRTEDGSPAFALGPLSPTAMAAILLAGGVLSLIVRFLPKER